ncbi:Cytoplasmic tRNA 2-thiolation protein 2-B [Nymphon striatum]|nr:Cytoplasmic tRNA 2-thiolation protein 2-B [Nymphon striatum]
MCSSQCDIPIEDQCLKESKICVDSKCKRCENKSEIVLRKKDLLCRSCFTTYVTHKFRSTIGKSRVMKPNDKVLIAYSGGQASAAMLHFITEGQEEVARKKVLLAPLILYIEELNFNKMVKKEIILATHHRIRSNIALSRYPAYTIKLEMVFSDNITKDMIFPIDSTTAHGPHDEFFKKKFECLINTIGTQSALEDLILRLKIRLISECAGLLDCPKVFMGDSASRLSVRIVSGLALGRGGQISSEMFEPKYATDEEGEESLSSSQSNSEDDEKASRIGEQSWCDLSDSELRSLDCKYFILFRLGFLDERHENVAIIRPMRELLSKEIAFYNFIHKIPFAPNVEIATETNLNSSIQRLTEEFINGLQRDFPSTKLSVKCIWRLHISCRGQHTFYFCMIDEARPGSRLLFIKNSFQFEFSLICTNYMAIHAWPDMQFQSFKNPGPRQLKITAGHQSPHFQMSVELMSTSGIEAHNVNKSSAMEALDLLERLKNISIGEELHDLEDTAENPEINEDCIASGVELQSKDILKQKVCYACRIIINDMNETDYLPKSILLESNPMNKMKEMIGSYLIDGEDET